MSQPLLAALESLLIGGTLQGEGRVQPVDRAGRYPAVLALHGFGATPNEVELVTELATALGLRTRSPLLPGHGSTVAELAKTRYADWYSAADQHCRELAEQGPVLVAGQSMGSLLALDLAAQRPGQVCGVAAMAPATRMASPYPNLALALVERLGLPDFALPKFGGPNLADPEQRRSHLNYDAQPVRAALSLRRAGLRVLEKLPLVSCPLFIAHGQNDLVCPVSNAWEVADRSASRDVEVVLLARSAHIITKDTDRLRLRRRLAAFVQRLAAQRPVEP